MRPDRTQMVTKWIVPQGCTGKRAYPPTVEHFRSKQLLGRGASAVRMGNAGPKRVTSIRSKDFGGSIAVLQCQRVITSWKPEIAIELFPQSLSASLQFRSPVDLAATPKELRHFDLGFVDVTLHFNERDRRFR